MDSWYLWVKVIHILALVSWMAGLFYLPRLFVYHAERGRGSEVGSVFQVMERRLLVAIMRPAATVTVLAGIVLIILGDWYGPIPVWLWLKMAVVAGLVGYHGVLERHCIRFRDGVETGSGRYFRILNEVPTVALIAVVILVVVKPF